MTSRQSRRGGHGHWHGFDAAITDATAGLVELPGPPFQIFLYRNKLSERAGVASDLCGLPPCHPFRSITAVQNSEAVYPA